MRLKRKRTEAVCPCCELIKVSRGNRVVLPYLFCFGAIDNAFSHIFSSLTLSKTALTFFDTVEIEIVYSRHGLTEAVWSEACTGSFV